jgi:hypothetical protein
VPVDLYRQLLSIVRDTSRTLSESVVDLMRRGDGRRGMATMGRDLATGLPLVRPGKVITAAGKALSTTTRHQDVADLVPVGPPTPRVG